MTQASGTLVAGLRRLNLSGDQRAYLELHGRRWELLLEGLKECVTQPPRADGPVRILDVGPALQTELIRRAFPEARVDTLGFASPLSEPREGERHYDLDLNRLSEGEPPDLGVHEVIVVAEVIEHLATRPGLVFEALAGWVAPRGWVVIQTPNSLALHKRLRALAGRSPLGGAGDVSAGSHSAAHFREYTSAEIAELAAAAGFEVVRASVGNHFRHPGAARRAYDRTTEFLPAGTRQGITAYLRRR